jgi:hypothetical protein
MEEFRKKLFDQFEYIDKDCLDKGIEALLEQGNKDNVILEFGVYQGNTIKRIADNLPDATIVGFDSFYGLPEKWKAHHPKGHFNKQGKIPDNIPDNVCIYKGLFYNTIPLFKRLIGNNVKITLLHIDCDLYSSTKDVFDHLSDNIQKGTIIVFDELYNYDGWENHEFKAVYEFCRDKNKSVKGLYLTRREEKAMVIVL